MVCESHEGNEVTSSICLTEDETVGDDGAFFCRELLGLTGLEPTKKYGCGNGSESETWHAKFRK
jgi:hypothetical protein